MKPEYVEDGNQMIVDMCRSMVVVDVGCIGNPEAEVLCGQYKKRYEVAKECHGLDLNEQGIRKANNQGVKNLWRVDVCDTGGNVAYGGAASSEIEFFMSMRLTYRKRFDLVIATDIIEHLMNVGNFLVNMKHLMNENSKLVIGTANIFHLTYWMRKAKGTLEISHEHTCWYDEVTLRQVVEFAGYKVEKMFYYGKPQDEASMYVLDMQGGKFKPWMSKRIGAVASL